MFTAHFATLCCWPLTAVKLLDCGPDPAVRVQTTYRLHWCCNMFYTTAAGSILGIVFWSVASFILTNSIIGKIQTHDVNVLPRILDVQLSAPRALSMLQNNGPWDSWRSQLHRQCGSILVMLLILLFDHLVCANSVCIMYHSSRRVFAWSNPQIYFSQIGNCMHFGETSWCHCKTCCGWGLESIFLQTQKLKNCNAAEAVVINLHGHRVARATHTAHQALKQMIMMRLGGREGKIGHARDLPYLICLHALGTLTMTVAQRLWFDFFVPNNIVQVF